MADALFIVPTVYARRDRLTVFLDACAGTIRGDTEIMLALDEEELGDWAPLLPGLAGAGPWLWSASAPRMALGPKMNRHSSEAAFLYPRVGFLADDTVPVTEGWDVKLTEALRTPGIAWARSNRRNDIPEHHLVSSIILRALGWYWMPKLTHYRADNVLADLGRAAGCLRYCGDVLIRHEHHEMGAAHDETYRAAEAGGTLDHAAYGRWIASGQCWSDAETVRKAVQAWPVQS